MTEWQNETCETCVFRVKSLDECRRFPPVNHNGFDSVYPYVANQDRYVGIYTPACAEYKPTNIKEAESDS